MTNLRNPTTSSQYQSAGAQHFVDAPQCNNCGREAYCEITYRGKWNGRSWVPDETCEILGRYWCSCGGLNEYYEIKPGEQS